MNAHTHISLAVSEPAPGPVSLRFVAPRARWSLRVDPAHLEAASEAFGLDLPAAIGARAASASRRALRLGPDEWTLWAGEAEADAVAGAFDELYGRVPHSLVSISDRDVALELEGPEAAILLSIGCPIDIERMQVGAGKRTVLDGVGVVLLREAPDRWTLEVWRSFVPHVWDLLNTGNRELAAGP